MGTFQDAPKLKPLHTLRLTAMAWALTAALVGLSGGEPAYNADAYLTVMAFLLLLGGEYDAASWIYMSTVVPWMLRT